jgi:hypothetical protein
LEYGIPYSEKLLPAGRVGQGAFLGPVPVLKHLHVELADPLGIDHRFHRGYPVAADDEEQHDAQLPAHDDGERKLTVDQRRLGGPRAALERLG